MLDFGVRGFRTGRALEGAIEQFIESTEKAQQEAEANPQPPPPSPEEVKANADIQKQAEALKVELQKHGEELQARMKSEADANKLKADDLVARREETMRKVEAEEKKLSEELKLRRMEVESQAQKTQAEIRKIEAEIKKLESETGAAEIKEIMGEIPEPVAGPTPVDEADSKAKMAGSQTTLLEAQIKYLELQKRYQQLQEMEDGLPGGDGEGGEAAEPQPTSSEILRDAEGNLVGMKSEKKLPAAKKSGLELPSDLGSPTFGQPPKPKRLKRLHQVVRDEGGNITGLTTDEVEMDDDGVDDAQALSASLGSGPPVPPPEAAPGVQTNGLPTPPSEMAAVDPKKPIGAE
jgi:hypothetical protein